MPAIRLASAFLTALLAVLPAGVDHAVAQAPAHRLFRLAPGQAFDQSNAATLPAVPPVEGEQSPYMVRLQVLLDRAHASPGVIDGFPGDNVDKAVMAFQEMAGLPVTGQVDPPTWAALTRDGAPALERHVLTRSDVRGPFARSIPTDYGKMSRRRRLSYRNPVEKLAERFHMDQDLLRQLNPGAAMRRAGRTIIVARRGEAQTIPVVRVVADKNRRQVLGYDGAAKLVVAYPATIGSEDMPSPTGTHLVNGIAFNPVYHYRPKVNFQQGRNTRDLDIPPGPNNPVGTVWIDLDAPTYGIHGTPDPSRIDKTNSHGCVRLTNWDAEELARLVKKGVPVEFGQPSDVAGEAR